MFDIENQFIGLFNLNTGFINYTLVLIFFSYSVCFSRVDIYFDATEYCWYMYHIIPLPEPLRHYFIHTFYPPAMHRLVYYHKAKIRICSISINKFSCLHIYVSIYTCNEHSLIHEGGNRF